MECNLWLLFTAGGPASLLCFGACCFRFCCDHLARAGGALVRLPLNRYVYGMFLHVHHTSYAIFFN